MHNEDLQGSKGIEVASIGCFIITKDHSLMIYDLDSFEFVEELCVIEAPEKQENNTPLNKILSIALSGCEKFMAVLTGKDHNMSVYSCEWLVVYSRREPKEGEGEYDVWQLHKEIFIGDDIGFK